MVEPEERQGMAEAQLEGRVARLHGQAKGRPQVVMFGLQPGHDHATLGGVDPGSQLLGQAEVEGGVLPLGQGGPLRVGQLVLTVLPDGLQQPIAHLAAVGLGEDQGLVHEARQQLEELTLLEALAGADPSAASSVQPPAKTESRMSSRRSFSGRRA